MLNDFDVVSEEVEDEEGKDLSFEQIISRIQFFHDFMWSILTTIDYDLNNIKDEDHQVCLRAQKEVVEELIDLYSDIFKALIYETHKGFH